MTYDALMTDATITDASSLWDLLEQRVQLSPDRPMLIDPSELSLIHI